MVFRWVICWTGLVVLFVTYNHFVTPLYKRWLSMTSLVCILLHFLLVVKICGSHSRIIRNDVTGNIRNTDTRGSVE
ncbi:hypothetical protein GDO81_016074 [Engystomops pustulosus]|uniref:Uncharacterized protein n=1 Tax=Engystomops pustulosus TaxID=76066 RepID=A0AAV7AVS0_ENGPU|nr:hypothetical protein GDO81_016074 [Engystomops pustulosus]